MYFPIGWPKSLDLPDYGSFKIRKICCDRVKILFAILTDDTLAIWYTKPCVPIVFHRREKESLIKNGPSILVEWKPDSSMLVVITNEGTLLLYNLSVNETIKGVYNQTDSPYMNVRRASAELFVKETIPSLILTMVMEVKLFVQINCISCVSVSQMMLATKHGKVLRIRWDGIEERDFSLDLKRIPFSINQQVNYAVPILEDNTYITSMDYSPLVGGFAIILNDGRAAFLTANNLRFDPNQVQGIWAQNLEDATCTSINHKYRLIAFGRQNSQANVYTIDDLSGGLELSHKIILSSKDFPNSAGYVREMKFTPDGCAIIISWSKGGISLWSTFGAMLMCSLVWDYGLHVDLSKNNPLDVISMDWSTEGYQLFMVRKQKKIVKETTTNLSDSEMPKKPILVSTYSNSSIQSNDSEIIEDENFITNLVQLDFVKSALSVNPCMSFHSHLFLQGDDKLYINQGDSLQKIYHNSKSFSSEKNTSTLDSPVYTGGKSQNSASYNICTDSYINGEIVKTTNDESILKDLEDYELGKSLSVTNMLSESKHWVIIQLPTAYSATNWPIRYSAVDKSGLNLAVAGRTGIALYSMTNRKWKLFGNESQEKDFVVTGGLLWWQEFLIMGCYSLIEHNDELRLYPKDAKLDNRFAKIVQMAGPVMLINSFKDQLIVFTADGYVTVFSLIKHENSVVDVLKLHVYDIRGLCVHPACIVSVTMTNLRNDFVSRVHQASFQQPATLVLNVSGRLLTVQKENNGNLPEQLTSTCLASCVECIWLSDSQKTHLKESLWLFCGASGMRVWLPVFPREGESGQRSHRHTFMSKRIMLSFALRVYPLAILFEDAIILGAENDTVLYTSDSSLHFSLPFSVLERTSQVYLHQILRQLIRRNLGYNAWEIARSCTHLPYFPHSLELLLHEVLEEEATSKEPIPDAQMPSVLEFIQEFPVYLQTVVQCARKTEIALWPYLFATAGKPKELFQQCLSAKLLETAASYLIILQNLEPSAISRQYATLLLDTALEQKKWDLAKDLVRFLRAIDPNDVESPRSSFLMGNKLGLAAQTPPPVTPNAEDLSLILGTMARGRSFSTTMNPKSEISNPSTSGTKEKSPGSIVDTSAAVLRRKKSVPNTQKEKEKEGGSSAEEFFIDVILQRHARRLLQDRKLEDLGYMSASLDFHLVGWLAREKDRAARIEDFVSALKKLHDDLDWPKPSLDLKLERRGSQYQSQQESPSYSLQSLRIDTNDSGYTSLPNYYHETPTNFSTILENQTVDFPTTITETDELQTSESNQKKSFSENDLVLKTNIGSIETEAKLLPILDNGSIVSEQVSMWGGDDNSILNQEIDQSFNKAMENLALQNQKKVSHKLEVKLRYLLQIFTEAGCLEFSLLLSILLMDASSICRITNSAIRTGSLTICRQLRNGLKDVTRWSFHECLGYRLFMMALQQQIAILDKFVIQQESIPNFIPPLIPNLNILKTSDKNEITKNTQSSITKNIFIESIRIDSPLDNSTILTKKLSTSDPIIQNLSKLEINGADSVSVNGLEHLPKPESTGCAIM